jgi:hypothetical protein
LTIPFSIIVILTLSIIDMELSGLLAVPSINVLNLLFSLPQRVYAPVMLFIIFSGTWGRLLIGFLIASTVFDTMLAFARSTLAITITQVMIPICFLGMCLFSLHVLSTRVVPNLNEYPQLFRDQVVPVIIFFGTLPLIFTILLFRRKND